MCIRDRYSDIQLARQGIVLEQNKEPALSGGIQRICSRTMENVPIDDLQEGDDLSTIARKAGIIDENTGRPLYQMCIRDRDYGVDPFSAGPNRRSDRPCPYGMTGTYEWNFADYDQQTNTPDRDQAARKKRGRMAAILVGCLVGIFAIFFCGYSIYNAIDSRRSEQESSSPEISALPGLNIQDTPSDASVTEPTNGKLSDKEIIKKVSPAVVEMCIRDRLLTM